MALNWQISLNRMDNTRRFESHQQEKRSTVPDELSFTPLSKRHFPPEFRSMSQTFCPLLRKLTLALATALWVDSLGLGNFLPDSPSEKICTEMDVSEKRRTGERRAIFELEAPHKTRGSALYLSQSFGIALPFGFSWAKQLWCFLRIFLVADQVLSRVLNQIRGHVVAVGAVGLLAAFVVPKSTTLRYPMGGLEVLPLEPKMPLVAPDLVSFVVFCSVVWAFSTSVSLFPKWCFRQWAENFFLSSSCSKAAFNPQKLKLSVQFFVLVSELLPTFVLYSHKLCQILEHELNHNYYYITYYIILTYANPQKWNTPTVTSPFNVAHNTLNDLGLPHVLGAGILDVRTSNTKIAWNTHDLL